MLKNAVIITGGSSFVGTNMVKYLLDNTNVSIVDMEYRQNKFINNFHITYPDRYTHESVCLEDNKEIDKVLKYYRPIGVIHLANYNQSNSRVWECKSSVCNNLLQSFNLVDSIVRYVEHRRINKDSFKVVQLYKEDKPETLSQYYTSKISGESVVDNLCERFDISCVNVKSGTLFGKYQDSHEFLPSIIIDLIINKPLNVTDRPINLIHVDDLVPTVYEAIINKIDTKDVNNTHTSVSKVATLVATLLDDMIDVPEGRESYLELIEPVDISEMDMDGEFVMRVTELIMWYNLMVPKE